MFYIDQNGSTDGSDKGKCKAKNCDSLNNANEVFDC